MTARPAQLRDINGAHPSRDSEPLAGIVDSTIEVRARRVLQHLSATDRKLGTAESCTGGLVASLFTDVEGVSPVFDRGFGTVGCGVVRIGVLDATLELMEELL